MKELPLSNGLVALVDDSDFDDVFYLWDWYHAENGKSFYAYRCTDDMLLHRFILRPPSHLLVDHWDGNGLNCTRANLRLATHSQNLCNRIGLNSNNTSGYPGVSFCNTRNKWVARIKKDYKSYNLGRYSSIEEAVAARQKAELEVFGEFSPLTRTQTLC